MNKSKFGKRLRKIAEQAASMHTLITKAHAVRSTEDLPIDTGGLFEIITNLREKSAYEIARYKEYKAGQKRRKAAADPHVDQEPLPTFDDLSFVDNRPLPTSPAPTMKAAKRGKR